MTILDFRRRGFRIRPDGERLLVQPAESLTESDRAFIRNHKPELLAALSAEAEALESALTAIQAEAMLLTTDEHLLSCVANLLADCRAMAREGNPDGARRYAEHLAHSIPDYLRGLRRLRGFNERA